MCRRDACRLGVSTFVLVAIGIFQTIAVSTTQPARAQAQPEGRVLSFVCGDVPEDVAFDVVADSDDELSEGVAEAFADELAKLGQEVAPGGRYAITMDAQVELGRVDAPEPSLGRLKVKDRGVEVWFNIWSNRKDSLLGGRRGQVTKEPTRLVVSATLRDRETGKSLWWGEATGALGNARPLQTGRALMPALAKAFGCTLSLKDIPLPNR